MSRIVRIENVTRGVDVARHARWARRFWARLRGYLGRPAPRPGEGLLLSPCRSVHMLGMAFPLDIAFLDAAGRVLALHHGVRPGWTIRSHTLARHALELPAGALDASGTETGDVLLIHELDPPGAARLVGSHNEGSDPS